MTPVSLVINGQESQFAVEPRTQLADLLRNELRLTGTHLGCEQGVCGACTVLIDGKPQRACIAFAVDCSGAHVTTIEGLDNDEVAIELRDAFRKHHGLQCGFCTPGMLVTARDIVMRLGEVSQERIREELGGNLCRCTGYVGIVDAVASVCAGKQPVAVATRQRPDIPFDLVSSQPTEATTTYASPTARVAAPSLLARADHPSIEQTLTIEAAPAAVWAVLADIRRVVPCVPGAEIIDVDGNQLTARLRVSLGPVKATFKGHATVTLDHASQMGRVSGQGRDTGTSIEGAAHWQVAADPLDANRSVVKVAMSWRLSGAMAQFSRTGLIDDLATRLTAAFADNLQRCVLDGDGNVSAAAKPVGLFALLWSILRSRLFGS